jgi:hypothetical protein
MGNVEFKPAILGQQPGRAIEVGRNERLNAEQVKSLTDELEALTKQQADAQERQIFLPPSPKEIKDFDSRQERISAILVELRNRKNS